MNPARDEFVAEVEELVTMKLTDVRASPKRQAGATANGNSRPPASLPNHAAALPTSSLGRVRFSRILRSVCSTRHRGHVKTQSHSEEKSNA
jgi:hypothetical protein